MKPSEGPQNVRYAGIGRFLCMPVTDCGQVFSQYELHDLLVSRRGPSMRYSLRLTDQSSKVEAWGGCTKSWMGIKLRSPCNVPGPSDREYVLRTSCLLCTKVCDVSPATTNDGAFNKLSS